MTTANSSTPITSLRQLVGAPTTLPIGGLALTVKPLGWYDSVEAIEALMPALDKMPDIAAGFDEAQVGAWLAWASTNRDAVVHFAHLASGQPAEDVQELPPGLLVELLFGLLEVNADFFVQSLPGVLASLGGRVSSLAARVQAQMAGPLAKQAATSTSSAEPGNTSSSAATATAS